jgi:hypothetical protein
MSAVTVELLSQVTSQVLEEAAFLFLEPADRPPPFVGELLEGRIRFRGPGGEGELLLATTAEVSESLAANLLGLEPGAEDTAAQARDALGEIVNIIGGALIEQLFGSAPCSLGLPQVASVEPAVHDRELTASGCAISFLTDEGARIDAAMISSVG